MWKKYSEDHKGFCVGFHTTLVFQHLGGGGEVQYGKFLLDIFPSDDLHVELEKKSLDTKGKEALKNANGTGEFLDDAT